MSGAQFVVRALAVRAGASTTGIAQLSITSGGSAGDASAVVVVSQKLRLPRASLWVEFSVAFTSPSSNPLVLNVESIRDRDFAAVGWDLVELFTCI
jgi:hypothetical protein